MRSLTPCRGGLCGIAVVAAGWGCQGRVPASPAPWTLCPNDLPGRHQSLALLSRSYDLAITPRGTYVLGLALGVSEIDPCTLARVAHCDDTREAQRVHVREGSARVVDYLRRDGTVASCDLSRSSQVQAPASTPAFLSARRSSRAGHDEAWVEGGEAWLRPGREAPRRLSGLPDEALDVALVPDRGLVAVSDRSGGVSMFSVPGGLFFERFTPHPRNVYALAYDRARSRIVSVAGPGRLDVYVLATPREGMNP